MNHPENNAGGKNTSGPHIAEIDEQDGQHDEDDEEDEDQQDDEEDDDPNANPNQIGMNMQH